MEPLKWTLPNTNMHGIINLSTKDITYSPSIVSIQFEPPMQRGQLATLQSPRTNQLNLSGLQSVIYLNYEVPLYIIIYILNWEIFAANE